MDDKVVTIFGGTGFLGRHVVRLFAKEGAFIRVCVRNLEEGRHLLTMGNVGQITLERCNIRDDATVQTAVRGSDIVINLVGILFEKGKQTFQAVHVDAAKRIAEAAKKANVKQLVHVSALGVAKDSPSTYARSKTAGESAILSVFPDAVIVRPSVIFGPEDNFFNKLAYLACWGDVPLISEKAKFQPVYVGDVAKAILTIFQQGISGRVFELGGPKVYTFRAIAEFILQSIKRPRRIRCLPIFLAKFIAFFAQFMPKPFLTPDQIRLAQSDSIVSGKTETFQNLNISPQALEGIVPTYLTPFLKN